MGIAKEYRDRADELRAIADQVRDQQAGEAILRVARRYDAMAQWRERQDGKSLLPEFENLGIDERDAARYRRRAQELRTLADSTHDAFCRDTLREVAERYDEIARVLMHD